MRAAVLCALTLLAGCAGDPSATYVVDLPQADAAPLALAVDNFVTLQLPQPGAPVGLRTPAAERDIAPMLRSLLERQGYRLVDHAEPGTHWISYAVTALDDGTLLRVFVDHTRAARLYVRNTAGELQASGPYMVVEVRS